MTSDASSPLPLAGVRVLDLSRLLPGGFCSLLLADYGADVLKVEDTAGGDYIRWAPPHVAGAAPSAGSALFLALNRNKRSIRIDLKQPAGLDVLLALVRDHDVVLESFRPGVLDRLGAGYEALRAANPRIVLCSISGYGQSGPLRDRAGHDLNYIGLTGLLDLGGEPGGPPVQPAAQIADLGGGALMAAFGILAALRERDRSGEGQHVDVSMTDGALSWLALVAARELAGAGAGPPRRGLHELAGGHRLLPPVRLRGRWLGHARRARAALLGGVVSGVGRDGPRSSTRSRRPAATPTPRSRRSSPRARAPSGSASPARSSAAWSRSSTSARRSRPSTSPRAGWSSGSTSPGSPNPCASSARRSACRARRRTPNRLPGPALGEHTEAVLRAAGYGDEQIAELLRSGAVAGPHAGEPGGSFLA